MAKRPAKPAAVDAVAAPKDGPTLEQIHAMKPESSVLSRAAVKSVVHRMVQSAIDSSRNPDERDSFLVYELERDIARHVEETLFTQIWELFVNIDRPAISREFVASNKENDVEGHSGKTRVVTKRRSEPVSKEEQENIKSIFEDASTAKAVGAMLAQARREAGVTQAEIAKRLGSDRTNISRLENGRAEVSLEFARKYAAALGGRLRMGVDLN